MFLAKVEGSIVATKKDPSMGGRKLLLLRPQLVDDKDPTKFRPGVNTIVAVDSVGAGVGEMVLFCQGSSARLTTGLAFGEKHADIVFRRCFFLAANCFDDPLCPTVHSGCALWGCRR